MSVVRDQEAVRTAFAILVVRAELGAEPMPNMKRARGASYHPTEAIMVLLRYLPYLCQTT